MNSRSENEDELSTSMSSQIRSTQSRRQRGQRFVGRGAALRSARWLGRERLRRAFRARCGQRAEARRGGREGRAEALPLHTDAALQREPRKVARCKQLAHCTEDKFIFTRQRNYCCSDEESALHLYPLQTNGFRHYLHTVHSQGLIHRVIVKLIVLHPKSFSFGLHLLVLQCENSEIE